MQEEKRVEEQEVERREEHRLSRRKVLAVAAFGALLVLVSMAVGFVWCKHHALLRSVHKCGFYLVVPKGSVPSGDYNVPVCYQEVNGIPYSVALCPTPVGVRVSFVKDLNSQLAYELYENCKKISSEVEVNAG